ncbi:DNA polymerase Y family protein [Sphingomonas sp.]|uniref:Y-family DNA polymerase n=1 Tax=Sphingomonas sp. TaxID=28214 RepID=UPI002E359EF5|nr:DNA polymerase Y family protein [Sphingomonas sp.]HEX4694099.1 DNA polymerase Y family protein [Sphingomonas sp.]
MRIARAHLFAGAGRDVPYAVVEKVKGAQRLYAVDPAAARSGIEPGMPLADARARVPELAAFDHAPYEDHRWLERLADGCTRYTPWVMLDTPDGLVLDVTGCVHLFGSEAALVADAVTRLERLGVAAAHAFADNPDAARALARWRVSGANEEEAIRRLPVAALGLDDQATLALKRAGLKTVGDVVVRPSSAIAARFGGDAAARVRRIIGETDSPLAPRTVKPPLHVERRFAEPVARTEFALEVVGELMAEAVFQLEQSHEGGRRFEARFFRTDGLVQRLAIETGRPSRDVAAVLRLFRERIDALADPIDPGFGFDLIRLDIPIAERLDAAQLKLEGGAVAEAELAALIDRLSTRLGRGRVRRFVPRDRHLPEQAEFMLPAVEPVPAGEWPTPEPGEPPLRPIHLFDPPQRIEQVIAGIPDGPPARFRWRRMLHDVARAEGPERIAAPWWTKREAPTRDYYRVEDRRGRRLWIFRHGLFEDGKSAPAWYVHGIFA